MLIRKISLMAALFCTNTSFSQVFTVQIPPSDKQETYSGNMYIFLSRFDKEPVYGSNFPVASPVMKRKVTGLRPGSVVELSVQNSEDYPVPVTDLERGTYFVQAIFDRSVGFTVERELIEKAGNLYSNPSQAILTHDLSKKYVLIAGNTVPEKKFTETRYTRGERLHSVLLSKFHQKDIYMTAAVVFPDTLIKNPDAHLPLCINISGFGGNYRRFSGNTKNAGEFTGEKDFIYVFLDGNCSNGHTVYANSDNNGPWGDALVQELIPDIEKKFHTNGFRYVCGHSSGGWAALYLQLMYPDFFQSCWASSPDSYDFRNIADVDIYHAGSNVYYDQDSNPRPAVLLGGSIPLAYIEPIAEWESIVPGGQFNSFNAVFSGKGPDGAAESLWDRTTGVVRQEIASQWKKYDLALYLKENWGRLAPKLSGKILITVGDQDNFFLEKPNRLFQQDAEKEGIPVKVRFYSGDHFTVLTGPVMDDAKNQLETNYKKWEAVYANNK